MSTFGQAGVIAYIALGANLGDAAGTLRQAMQDMGAVPHTRLVRASSLYRSAPVQAQGPDFINAVVQLETHLCAPDLLAALQRLELQHGRQRPYVNAPRTLDLDLLLYGAGSIHSPALTLPHPRMQVRAFVLLPLAEIAPHWVTETQLHRVSGQTISRLP